MARRVVARKNELKEKQKEMITRLGARVREQNALFDSEMSDYHRKELQYRTHDSPMLLDFYNDFKAHLSKEILQMNLIDFLAEKDDEKEEEKRALPQMGALNDDDTEMIDEEVEVRPPTQSTQVNNTKKNESLPQTNTMNTTDLEQPSIQSVPSNVSANGTRSRPLRALTVETSMGNTHLVVPKVPRIIATRMKSTDKVIAGRVLARNELGFSIHGSPLVAASMRQQNEGIAEVCKQVLTRREEELTPMSKDLATVLKAALRSKFNNE